MKYPDYYQLLEEMADEYGYTLGQLGVTYEDSKAACESQVSAYRFIKDQILLFTLNNSSNEFLESI